MRPPFRQLSFIGLVLALVAWPGKSSTAARETFPSSADALRAAFNADAGKVRVLMLLSPT